MKHNDEFKSWQKKFYKSKDWIKLKNYIAFNRDLGICQMCKRHITSGKWIVDHLEEINPSNKNDKSITLNSENLQLLCISCHNKKTFRNYKPVIRGPKKNRDLFDKYK